MRIVPWPTQLDFIALQVCHLSSVQKSWVFQVARQNGIGLSPEPGCEESFERKSNLKFSISTLALRTKQSQKVLT